MNFIIRGDKIVITNSIKEFIEQKVSKLEKYFTDLSSINARVVVKVRGREQIVEVTIPINGIILRSEESHSDLYAAIDLVVDKLERQIRKNKTKIQSKTLKYLIKNFKVDSIEELKEDKSKIVKRKKIEMKPMSEEEAVLQINMLSHDFFIYKDAKTNKICVLYKRKDGNYGVIATD
ncbi:MAG: ribosome hibernation-promoting factor, HPF/YfiA family [Bacilli bacterium]|jgi:putative sigma-54 modulation protein